MMKSAPKPEQFGELMSMPADKIFAAIVVLYGEKLANELADELLNGGKLPTVQWPRF
ncbi:hypothetical protein [Neorhizobium sp. NCHU2750]|uniref:hypothetical protein n=1 Tax=Neorhizobium sp. NCHU2750 TaxID=1825976 RepID=UPI000EB706A3|nr:hypothetical protein NCHU2750_06170 [Neorhizobium sp. NCHU2750]